MINDVANEMVLQPSMSSNDVKTVVSNNHEMASTSSLVAEPLKKKRKKYTDKETTLITRVFQSHSRITFSEPRTMPGVLEISRKRHGRV